MPNAWCHTVQRFCVLLARNYPGVAGTGGWEFAENCDFLDQAEKVATDAVEFCTAKPLGSSGLRDLLLSPSHAMLTIHEIVAHPTELDRIVGYEANYAGTSFVKVNDIGKLKFGSKHMNVTCDKTSTGLGTVGYDDDGVESQKWPLIREGVLVGLQTNRETAHLIGENFSRGCTFGTTWRDYPFLRMPNVHVEPGPENAPTREQLIGDMKNGVIIDGRGSYSIDQQRYNGQFGGYMFWEVKNGKITRQVTDVTQTPLRRTSGRTWMGLPGRRSGRCTGRRAMRRGSRRRPILSRVAARGC